MSEQAERTNGEPSAETTAAAGVANNAAAPAAAEADAAAARIDAPKLAPETAGETAKAASGGEAPQPEPASDTPRSNGSVTIMAPHPSWDHQAAEGGSDANDESKSSALFGKRRISALAAVVALAAFAGAIGGALATAGIGLFQGDTNASSIQAKLLDEQVTRIGAELAALKTAVEHSAKLSVAQVSKTSDRLDRIEKAQAEPLAKLAKLSDAVEKLRAAPPPAPTPVAAAPTPARETTGSIAPTPAVAPVPVPRPEVARLPTVDGWVLHEVASGTAVIEGRQGVYEVMVGDPVPGVGRVDAIRRQDGRWVVVTSRGLIVAR